MLAATRRPAGWRRRSASWLWLGVVGASVLFGSLALLRTFTTPPFSSADEAQHVSYALAVADGNLPEIDDPVRARLPGMPGIPADAERPGRPPDNDSMDGSLVAGSPDPDTVDPDTVDPNDLVYTANHPPLFYAIEAVPLSLVDDEHALLAGRAVNVGIGVAVVVAAAVLVQQLVPNRPDLAVAASALTGASGLLDAVAGQVYNDCLAVATTTAALAATVVVARRGPSTRRLVVLAAALLATAATRASGTLLVGPAILAAAAGVAIHAGGPWRRRAGQAAAVTDVLVAVVVAGIGWFYLLNIRRYGDPTGAGRIDDLFGGRDVGVLDVIGSREFWATTYEGLWGRAVLVTDLPAALVYCILAASTVGLVLVAARARVVSRVSAARSRRSRATTYVSQTTDAQTTDPDAGLVVLGYTEPAPIATAASEASRRRMIAAVVWTLIAVHVLVVVAAFVGYVATGGARFPRYLLPALPAGTLLLAAGLAGLPGSRWGLPTSAGVGAMAAGSVVLASREIGYKNPSLAALDTLDRLRVAMDASGPASSDVLVPVLLVCGAAGLLTVIGTLIPLSVEAVPRWPWRSTALPDPAIPDPAAASNHVTDPDPGPAAATERAAADAHDRVSANSHHSVSLR